MSIRTGQRRRTAVCVVLLIIAGLVAIAAGGPASASVDNSNQVTTLFGDQVTVAQSGTRISSVPPLDSSPLSKEFFADTTTTVAVTGPYSQYLQGSKLTIGYHIGYPVSVEGAVLNLTSPSISVSGGPNISAGLSPAPSVSVGADVGVSATLIPPQELSLTLRPGGITEVPLINGVPFDGPVARVMIGGMHGSVSGAAGPVTVRPYAQVVIDTGDTVITYGKPVQL
ncbi:MspA family porin [Nocardia sp. IBHARD005]|uniref:MspA family porin n=1 Tax=Nocardia sp. IBHARD005 TaxID=3457765 RepID=UPI004057D3D7